MASYAFELDFRVEVSQPSVVDPIDWSISYTYALHNASIRGLLPAITHYDSGTVACGISDADELLQSLTEMGFRIGKEYKAECRHAIDGSGLFDECE